VLNCFESIFFCFCRNKGTGVLSGKELNVCIRLKIKKIDQVEQNGSGILVLSCGWYSKFISLHIFFCVGLFPLCCVSQLTRLVS
jgi:hypothetical protein